MPAGVLRRVEQQLAFERLAQSRLLAALDEALLTLHAAGVHAAALKGPVLAERIYPDPTLRLSTDLDLLVAPADLDRSTAALEAIGYQAETGDAERYSRKHHHHIHLSRPHTPWLELHFRPFTGFGIVIESEEFLSRALPYTTARGPIVLVLSPEDECFYLCIHTARHQFRRLSWLYELKLFLRRYPNLDWPAVVDRARTFRVVTVLSFTLEILRQRLGVAIPSCSELGLKLTIRSNLADWWLSATPEWSERTRSGRVGRAVFFGLLCDRPASLAGLVKHRLLPRLQR